MSAKLPKSWPSTARRIVLDAARYYYQEMNEPFSVPDVAMDRAIEWANKELDARRREVVEEASPRWINRWDRGQLDVEMKKVIDATYGNLRRAERGIRTGAGARKKKSPAQLAVEIKRALEGRR